MNYRYTLFSLLFILIFTAACQKDLPQINPPEQYSDLGISQEFEAFWNGMNNNYLFWDIDPTDWDEVYRTYKPLFAELDGNDENDLKQAYTYYQEMTAQLIDSHYGLVFSDSQFSIISPSGSRIKKRPGFHAPIPTSHYLGTVFTNYLNQNAVVGFSSDSSAALMAGKIKNTNILYFRFPSFSLKEWYTEADGSARTPIQYVLDELQKPNLDGIILDVRGNGGGNVDDLNFLVGRLTDKAYVFASTRAKGGMGRLDYLPWVNISVHPATGAKAFTRPIVVLTDMYSISMAEITAMSVKALPGGNGKVVGERTWGGTGPIMDNRMTNGGQFGSKGLIKLIYTASLMFRYKDGKIYEGAGFPPDVEAKYDEAALKVGKDTQLETAISQIQ